MNGIPAPPNDCIAVVLVAAGRGRRMGGESPKQYLDLGGRPVIRRTIDAVLSLPEISSLVCVTHGADLTLYREAVADLSDTRLLPPVTGAQTRAGSVRAGLEALEQDAPTTVLIHDAARPFVSAKVIRRVIAALGQAEGAFAALPVVDALWRIQSGTADIAVPRDAIWRAQTPQGFRFDSILEAHRASDGQGADDVAVARAAGIEVAVVEGEEANFKITTPSDMARARAMIEGLMS